METIDSPSQLGFKGARTGGLVIVNRSHTFPGSKSTDGYRSNYEPASVLHNSLRDKIGDCLSICEWLSQRVIEVVGALQI